MKLSKILCAWAVLALIGSANFMRATAQDELVLDLDTVPKVKQVNPKIESILVQLHSARSLGNMASFAKQRDMKIHSEIVWAGARARATKAVLRFVWLQDHPISHVYTSHQLLLGRDHLNHIQIFYWIESVTSVFRHLSDPSHILYLLHLNGTVHSRFLVCLIHLDFHLLVFQNRFS